MVTIGLVIADFEGHADIVEEMAARATEAARERGAEVERTEVPGAYDAPLAADRLARRDAVDAVVAVGAIISGDTDHDRVIATAAANGLRRVSLDRDLPVTFGITGPGMSEDEARARLDKGAEAVDGALDML
jgi:6,7-dimethyl-8-ribityllumazine synthase